MKYAILLSAVLLAGCAHSPPPRPQVHILSPKAPIVKQAPVAVTPNVVVKKRWFKGHAIKLFH